MSEQQNCTEKIIFCVDLSNEVDSLDFTQTTNTHGAKKLSRLDLIKNAIQFFVLTKKSFNPNHEFALVKITDVATWFQDFTSDTDTLLKKVASLQSTGDYPTFNALKKHEQPYDYIYRAIFLYSRSNTIPHFQENTKHSVQSLLNSPTFFFDALYLHSKPGKDNKPQEVYDFITEIEGKDHSPYFFENSTSIKRFTRHLASLLAHPLQRAEQNSSLGTFVAQ